MASQKKFVDAVVQYHINKLDRKGLFLYKNYGK